MTDLAFLPATELLAGYTTKRFSPVEVTRAVLERIGRHDKTLNAYRLVDAERALEQARAAEARWHKAAPLSLIDGMPTSIKDLFLTKGWPTLRGSRLIDHNQPWLDDAPAVARLREAGAVLLGKTNTSEFGWKGVTDSPLAGVTRNPWNPALTPGGSSGGGAAATAAGMATLSLCTDGGGSIRNPAAFTGLVGLKATFGRVPMSPPSPMGTLSNAGPIARSVADVALMMNVIAQPDPRDWLSLPYDARDYRANLGDGVQGLRVAFSPGLGFASVDPEVAALVAAAAQSFSALGARVEEADPPIGDVKALFDTHWHVGTAAAFAGMPAEKLKLLDPGLDVFVEKGKHVALLDYVAATVKRAQLGQKMREFHSRFDLLLVPTVGVPAFPVERRDPPGVGQDEWQRWTPFSYPFNMTMQPAISVPCGFTRAGLPVGLQIVGAMYREALVLQAAAALERAHPEHTRRPAM